MRRFTPPSCWSPRRRQSVKYEQVYLHAYESVSHAKASLARYFHFYNERRPHSALDRHTPDEAYFHVTALPKAA
jgi:putative transposase